MSYRHVLQLKAQQDYERSLHWYAERSEQAAINFVKAVEHAFELICEYPFRWPNKYKHYHEISLKK